MGDELVDLLNQLLGPRPTSRKGEKKDEKKEDERDRKIRETGMAVRELLQSRTRNPGEGAEILVNTLLNVFINDFRVPIGSELDYARDYLDGFVVSSVTRIDPKK